MKVYVVKDRTFFGSFSRSIHKSHDKAYERMMKYAEEHVAHGLKRGGQFAIEPDEYDKDEIHVRFKNFINELGREIAIDDDEISFYISEYNLED